MVSHQFCLKNAQNGEVGIPPWAEASKYEPYATFNDRLEKALEVLRVSAIFLT